MKFTNIALAGAAVGLAQAGPVTKRAVSDGKKTFEYPFQKGFLGHANLFTQPTF